MRLLTLLALALRRYNQALTDDEAYYKEVCAALVECGRQDYA